MDFSQLLSKTKILFDWRGQDISFSPRVSDLDGDSIRFEESIDPGELRAPHLTISIKVRHYWYEHEFERVSWKRDEEGRAIGLDLKEEAEKMLEWRKHLELGLCV